MPTILPPPPSGTATSPSAALPQAQAVNPSAAIQALGQGTVIEARVEAFLARGIVQVRAPEGLLQLQTAFPIPRAATILTLTVQTLAPNLLFQISAIDGKAVPGIRRPLDAPNAQALEKGTPSMPGRTAPASNQASSSAPGGAMGGRPGGHIGGHMSMGGGLPPIMAGLPGAIPGTVLMTTALSPLPGARANGEPPITTRLSGQVSPTAQATQSTPTGTAPAKASLGASLRGGLTRIGSGIARLSGMLPSSTSTPGTQAAAQPLQPGGQLEMRLLSVQQPGTHASGSTAGATPPASTTAPARPPLSATVNGQTTSGLPTLKTSLGTFALMTKTPLQAGAQLTFEMTATPARPGPAPGVSAFWAREGLAQGKEGWQNLTDALEVLKGADPKTHQAVIRAALPAADNRLAANMLFFLSALRGGDLRAWMGGTATRILQTQAPDVMRRLGDDFQQLSRAADDPASADWRLTVLPFLNGSAIEPIRFFLRGKKRDGDDGDDEATRFVIDVDMSQIGKIQLDGLIRAERKHVDLIIRTKRPLPPQMQQDIQTIFKDAGELTGMVGGLVFQAAPPDFVKFTTDGPIPPGGVAPPPAASA